MKGKYLMLKGKRFRFIRLTLAGALVFTATQTKADIQLWQTSQQMMDGKQETKASGSNLAKPVPVSVFDSRLTLGASTGRALFNSLLPVHETWVTPTGSMPSAKKHSVLASAVLVLGAAATATGAGYGLWRFISKSPRLAPRFVRYAPLAVLGLLAATTAIGCVNAPDKRSESFADNANKMELQEGNGMITNYFDERLAEGTMSDQLLEYLISRLRNHYYTRYGNQDGFPLAQPHTINIREINEAYMRRRWAEHQLGKRWESSNRRTLEEKQLEAKEEERRRRNREIESEPWTLKGPHFEPRQEWPRPY